MQHGVVLFESNQLIEVATPPGTGLKTPIYRVFCTGAFAPFPALVRPQLTTLITAIFHKPGKLAIRRRGTRNVKWLNEHLKRLLFIIKNKTALTRIAIAEHE